MASQSDVVRPVDGLVDGPGDNVGVERFRARLGSLVITVPFVLGATWAWWQALELAGSVLDAVVTLLYVIFALPLALSAVRLPTLRAELNDDGLRYGRRTVAWHQVEGVRMVVRRRRDGSPDDSRPPVNCELYYRKNGNVRRLRVSWFLHGPTGPLPARLMLRLHP